MMKIGGSMRLRTLVRDQKGASAVELGLIAPFLGFLVLGITDLGQGLAAQFELRQAAHRAVEMISVKPPTADGGTGVVDYEYLRTEAANAAGVDVEDVTLTKWLQCDGEEAGSYDDECDSDQETARYISIEIESSYELNFPTGPLAQADGSSSIPISAQASVRIQ